MVTAVYRFLRLLLRVALPAAALSASACGTSKSAIPEVSSKRAIVESDGEAKRQVSIAAVAAEDYRRRYGTWAGLTVAKLESDRPGIKMFNSKLSLSASPERYVITATSPVTNHAFKHSRTHRHFFQTTCTPAGAGGCPASGVWHP